MEQDLWNLQVHNTTTSYKNTSTDKFKVKFPFPTLVSLARHLCTISWLDTNLSDVIVFHMHIITIINSYTRYK